MCKHLLYSPGLGSLLTRGGVSNRLLCGVCVQSTSSYNSATPGGVSPLHGYLLTPVWDSFDKVIMVLNSTTFWNLPTFWNFPILSSGSLFVRPFPMGLEFNQWLLQVIWNIHTVICWFFFWTHFQSSSLSEYTFGVFQVCKNCPSFANHAPPN